MKDRVKTNELKTAIQAGGRGLSKAPSLSWAHEASGNNGLPARASGGGHGVGGTKMGEGEERGPENQAGTVSFVAHYFQSCTAF